jgi:parallel beta-helix repeat protein
LNNSNGIKIQVFSYDNTLENNTCISNSENGIYIYSNSYRNSIINNTCFENGNGIHAYWYASNNIIINNSCKSNIDDGLKLVKSTDNTLSNNTFMNNNNGIKMDDSSNNKIENCQIINNNKGIYFVNSSNATINYNNISDNTKFGINNTDQSIIINAIHNWWGNITGPYDPSDDRTTGGLYNPNGKGDNVTDYVIYKPWNLVNYPPLINITDLITIFEDQLYKRQYFATDLNGDTISWSTNTNATWLNWNSNNKTLYGIPQNNDVGSYWVCINATDGQGGFDEHNFTLTVINIPPKILINDKETAIEDQLYYNDYNSDDDTQGSLSWKLKTNATWLNLDVNSGNLTGQPSNSDVGQFWVDITVNDGNGGSDSTNFTLTVININDKPVIETIDNTTAYEDLYYEITYTAIDIDVGNILAWNYNSNANSWLDWGITNQTLFGIPRNEHVGEYWVRINISDGNGGYDEHNFTITVVNTNDRPVINNQDLISIKEDEYYEVVYSAIDVDIGDILTWTYSSDAPWLNWGATNHTLYGTPRNEHVGKYWVKINVTDGNGAYDERHFTLNVLNTNDKTIIETTDVTIAIEDEQYEVVYSAIDVDIGDTLTWTYDSNATWLNWGLKNQTLYGTPRNEHVGTYWVRLKAFDNSGDFDEHFFIITVVNVNDPPEIIGAPNELQIKSFEDYVLDLKSYIYDVDNKLSELKLNTNSKFAKIESFKITFNYPNTITSDKVEITVTDLMDTSKPYIIDITIILNLDNPTIDDKSPVGEEVPITTLITVTFNKPMDKTSTENSLEISPKIEGIFSWDGNKLLFTPNSDLQYNTTYSIIVKPTAIDIEGNPLVEIYSWNFTTEKQDTDNDNIPDDQDDDDDNDKFLDSWENFLGTNPKNPYEYPLDTDSDDQPNGDEENSKPWMDLDDDNDGYTDEEELIAGTDPLDKNDFPDEDETPSKKEDKFPVLESVIIIIIIIVVILILFFLLIKRKKKPVVEQETQSQPQVLDSQIYPPKQNKFPPQT